MKKQIKILGIAGSLRKASFNRGVLSAAADLVPEGASVEIFELDGFRALTRTRSSIRPRRSRS
jgi:chromate reductase, NAD(P)H dehydrogenase (quinone)